MKFTLVSLLVALSMIAWALPARAQEEAAVLSISCEKGQTVQVKGDLSAGQQIPLDWAASSQVACFPATRFVEFQGNHLFYRVELPRYSKIIISVKPEGRQRINLYGIRQGTNAGIQPVPPHVSVASSCEAGYPIYAGNPNLSKGGDTQNIEFMAINNPYSILIGVAGAREVLEGGFTLQVQISDR
jgi:hypothetical protein